MLKFIKHHMASIGGIDIYPIISFLIFFLFFVILIVWLVMTKKDYFKNIENLPLEDNLSNKDLQL